jgi:NAD(P)-dependent dehydrogenase (short-subunit alcohol dehydrogenase family)
MELAGRTAIVTGAGGSLGSAIVRAFRDAGARVVAVDIRAEAFAALPADPEIVTVVADVTVPKDAGKIVAAAGERIDVLCNCAAILGRAALMDEMSPEEWDRIIATNLTGPFLISRAVIPVMLRNGGGAIVNIASIAGLGRGQSSAAYTSSKHGLIGMTEHIAYAYGDRGIRANAICPGGMVPAMKMQPPSEGFAALFAKRKSDRPAPAPVDKVAAVAVFLASDGAAHINGAALPVDSGALHW